MKNSWNSPFRKKSSRRFISADDLIKQNTLVSSHIEKPTLPRKRFQPTQMFERKRVKDPFNLEEQKLLGGNEYYKTKATVIGPSKTETDLVIKDIPKIVGVFEKSRTGYIPIGPETGYQAKSNQDSWISIKSFCGVQDQYFLGVFDGHGFNGQKVSKYIKKRLPKNIRSKVSKENPSFIEKISREKPDNSRIISAFNHRRTSCPEASEEVDGNPFDKLVKQSQAKNKILEEWFDLTQQDLKRQKFDIEFSGTTAVTAIVSPSGVVTWANIGDSRAILISECNGAWSVSALSRDHKPELHDESERIKKYGGRIEAYKDEFGGDFGPKRVWLKNENLPGLAMSRSFGDLWACRAGVVQHPEIKDYQLTKNDRAIVLASDGVWEFLNNEDVMNILIPYLKSKQEEAGINEVIKKSVAHWKKEDVVIDDITVVMAVISSSLDWKPNGIENQFHTHSQKNFKMVSAYQSIPNFHMAHH